MVIVVIAALPNHLFLISHAFGPPGGPQRGLLAWAAGPGGTIASMALVVAIGLVATFVPLFLGLRSFRELEP
jgi:hypothetical protein